MKRMTIPLTAIVLGVLLVSGTALAATKEGTGDADSIRGTSSADSLDGRGGNDSMFGFDGSDVIFGGSGDDVLFGGNDRDGESSSGADTIYGDAGSDFINGGSGADALYGKNGNDTIVGGPPNDKSVDRIYGDGGADTIYAQNKPASRDIIYCGGGRDRVFADRSDIVSSDCETVDKEATGTFVARPMYTSSSSSASESGEITPQAVAGGDCGYQWIYLQDLGYNSARVNYGAETTFRGAVIDSVTGYVGFNGPLPYYYPPPNESVDDDYIYRKRFSGELYTYTSQVGLYEATLYMDAIVGLAGGGATYCDGGRPQSRDNISR